MSHHTLSELDSTLEQHVQTRGRVAADDDDDDVLMMIMHGVNTFREQHSSWPHIYDIFIAKEFQAVFQDVLFLGTVRMKTSERPETLQTGD